MKLADVNVLVLDECHAATGKAPYVQIMQNHYRDMEECKKPKILGLTACVINKKVKSAAVATEVRGLCNRLDSYLTTSVDAISFGTKPTEVIVCYKPMPRVQLDIHKDMVQSQKDETLFSQVERLLRDVGPFGATKAIQHRINLFNHLIEAAMAEAHVVANYKLVRDRLVSIEGLLSQWSDRVNRGLIVNQYPVQIPSDLRNILITPADYSFPPKVHRLLEMFKTFEKNQLALSCVIFAQERYTVFGLWCVLTMLSIRCPHRYGYIKVGFIMGQGSMSQYGDALSNVMNFVDERQPADGDLDVLEDFR